MDKIEVEVTDYGYSGEGVGKVNGKVCFVPYTLVGERAVAEVVQERAKFLSCKPLKIISPAAERTTPPCPYFGRCGGCAFQHTDYANELEIKLALLRRQLEKVGFGGEIEVFGSEKEYFYRNKIKLFCLGDKLALFEAASKNLAPIDKCLLVEEQINQAIEKVQAFVLATHIGGNIEHIIFRRQGGGTLVLFVLKRPAKIDFQGLQIMLGAKCGIFCAVKGQKPQHMTGLEQLSENEFGIECSYGPGDFHQVNNDVAQKMYERVAALVKGETIINGYSGAGLLSAILAKKAKTVYGIELGVAEHNSAQNLKDKNHIENLFNIQGDCAVHIPRLLTDSVKCVVVDPPRAGLDSKVCQALNAALPEQIIYISCNQATLVRDIERLGGYKIQNVAMFDMFARTSSVEVVCVLEKKC